MYAPFGLGQMFTLSDTGTARAKILREKFLESGSALNFTLFYFWNYLQGSFEYGRTSTQNQVISNTLYSSKSDFYAFRFGYRLSNPGDDSYHFFYGGIHGLRFKTGYNDTSMNTLGYFFGVSGFICFGTRWPFEFVLEYEAYGGLPFSLNVETDAGLENPEKKNSAMAGVSFGVGTHFEPLGIALCIVARGELQYISYSGTISSQDVEVYISTAGIYLGFEVTFHYTFNRCNGRGIFQ